MIKSLKLTTIILSFLLLSNLQIAQNIGINQSNPTHTLHISPITLGNDPIRIDGVQSYSIGDTSLLIINPLNGIVKYINPTDFVSIISSNSNNLGTDNQNIDSLVLSGSILTVYIEDGISSNVDLSSLSDADGDPTNEIQTLSLFGSNISLSNGGGTVSINDADSNPTNEIQTLSLSGSNISLSNGGGTVSINDADSNPTNEIQNLSISGNTLSISGGNSVNLSSFAGDITSVTAGIGLTGGGTSGAITVNAAANNGITVNPGADRIQLGGTLIQNTTITQGAFGITYNLNGTGDFNINDNGVNHFQMRDDGISFFGDDSYWRDGSTSGTNLVSITDDGNDGRLYIYENGSVSVNLDANSYFIFNEQGLDRDFRVESDNNTSMLFVDANTNRIGLGINAPSRTLDVNGNARIRNISTTTSTTVTPLYSDANGNIYKKSANIGTGPKFINPQTVRNSGSAMTTYSTYNASSYVPLGATAAILDYQYAISGPDGGDVDAHVYVRRDNSSPAYIMTRGRAAGNDDAVAGGGQIVVPLSSSRTFQYWVQTPGFNGGLYIRIIGYY